VRPRFQADADLHFDIVTGVLRREPAIDFQSAQELLTEAMEDPEVVAAAARQGRIVVSHDVNTMPEHFWRFLATHRHSPGLFLLPQTIPVAQAIEELVLIWAVSDAAEWEDRVVWLPL
jgi:hypothetical protein